MKDASAPGFCPRFEHISRRALLRGLLTTTGGLLVPNFGALFQSRALAAEAAKKGKRCIFIWADGGASQFETFDMKPDRPHAGPFRPIATNMPGYHICEYLPNIAQHVDKLTIVRSMRTSQVDHPGGTYLMHTAHSPEPNVVHPEIGSVVAKYLGDPDSPLPNFVQQSGFFYKTPGSGILGPHYEPFSIGSGGKLPATIDRRISPEQDARRRELLRFQQDTFLAHEKARPLASYDYTLSKSWKLMETKAVFDISDEWDKSRDLYGDSEFGKNCLLARRLIEAGVPFVEIHQTGSYDSHSDNAEWHKALLPPLDKGWSGLLVDLERRGMFEDTLVIWMGEIGRTPRINNRAGRDHYVKAWSMALAGGGVKRGLVYGKTDKDGATVEENPVSEGDLFATIYKALGIDPRTSHYAGLRPVPIVPEHSKVVEDLLA